MLALAAATLAPGTDLRRIVEVAANVGFDAVGLRPGPGDAALAVAGSIRAAGIEVLDVEVVRLGVTPDAEAYRLVDWAAAVEARYLLVVSHLEERAATAHGLHRLAERAAGSGVRPVLEFMRFTAVADLAEAEAVADLVGDGAVSVLVDALHLARSGGPVEKEGFADTERFPYLQLCDAPAAGPASPEALADEARHRRLLPGRGELPLGPLAEAFHGRPISIEVQSDAAWATMTDFEWAGRARRSAEDVVRGTLPPG